jgi:hypothetical protein
MGRRLVTHYLLFVISLADRVVIIAGITTRPGESWMLQIARNVTDAESRAQGTRSWSAYSSRRVLNIPLTRARDRGFSDAE